VHFAHRRHALVGDQVYGGRLALPKGASDESIQVLRHFKRQALHATRLAFEHPVSGESIDLEIAPPKDFQLLIETLRRDVRDE
jgi:23S rRNA pseudouridine1911/1915/1917 synthase